MCDMGRGSKLVQNSVTYFMDVIGNDGSRGKEIVRSSGGIQILLNGWITISTFLSPYNNG